jgi:hypothetical protein
MKQLFLIFALTINFCAFSQEDNIVTLTVSAQGSTSSEAKQNALRDAIEQAFGAFISSNTEILNDELIKDEIVSVSNGNIQGYKVISEVQLPNGDYATTLKATVSITMLTSFAESKGANIKFKGGLFAANMMQQELNEKAEFKAVTNIIKASKSILKKSFDYSIEPSILVYDSYKGETVYSTNSSPIKSKYGYKIPLIIKIKLNNNFDAFSNYFNTSMRQLSMSSEEIKSYKDSGKSFDLLLSYNSDNKKNPPQPVYFRNKNSLEQVNSFIKAVAELILDFEIRNGVNNIQFWKHYDKVDITMIDLFRIYVGDYEYYNSEGKPTYGRPSPRAIGPSLFSNISDRPILNLEGKVLRNLPEKFILSGINLNTNSARYRLKNKNQGEIQSSDRNIILNFYNFYSENFGTNYNDKWNRSYLKTTVPEEFFNEKAIIWINFYDTKTLDEIKQISEYTIKPILD